MLIRLFARAVKTVFMDDKGNVSRSKNKVAQMSMQSARFLFRHLAFTPCWLRFALAVRAVSDGDSSSLEVTVEGDEAPPPPPDGDDDEPAPKPVHRGTRTGLEKGSANSNPFARSPAAASAKSPAKAGGAGAGAGAGAKANPFARSPAAAQAAVVHSDGSVDIALPDEEEVTVEAIKPMNLATADLNQLIAMAQQTPTTTTKVTKSTVVKRS